MDSGSHSVDKFAAGTSAYPIITAILVDGGFYIKRSRRLFGDKTPQQRADELIRYCLRHVRESQSHLYRIFYYDSPPSNSVIHHPLTNRQINLGKSDQYKWMMEFHRQLVKKRKLALRKGELLESRRGFMLKADVLKHLLSGSRSISSITERDFDLDIIQKGVDMKLGLDIASLSHHGPVNQIVMIAGDSDFVPAAKYARRAGIDFILDPLWHRSVSDSLSEHIDGVRSCVSREPENLNDPLHVNNIKTS